MTIRPILMSGSMVRAVLRQIKCRDGKTQTRRIATAGTTTWDGGAWPQEWRGHHIGDLAWVDNSFPDSPILKINTATGDTTHRIRPRIEAGDLLYVREQWGTPPKFDQIPPRDLAKGSQVHYLAGPDDTYYAWGRLRQGMHMPRWASRITLSVTDVRFERLQDISETDAAAEGVAPCPVFWTAANPEYSVHGETNIYPWRIGAFTELWNNINEDRGFGWETNPWVVVIEFEPHLCNVDRMNGVQA